MLGFKKIRKADREMHQLIIGKTGIGRGYNSLEEKLLQDAKLLAEADRKNGPSGTVK